MSLDVQMDEVPESELGAVDYRWDGETEILCVTLRSTGVSEGVTGSIDIEGTDGAWLTLELSAGRLAAIEVAAWPDVRTVDPLEPPVPVGSARLRVPSRLGGAAGAAAEVAVEVAVEALEVNTLIRAVADRAERTIHFRIGSQRSSRTIRVAHDVMIAVDSRSRIAGLWLLNVPPFPTTP